VIAWSRKEEKESIGGDGRESFRAGLNMNLTLQEACKVGVTMPSCDIRLSHTLQHEPSDLSRGIEAVDVSVYAV
jgi:hypothetical protein